MANGNIGIYANASRPKIRILRGDGTLDANGPQVQVSRLGNPLVNEVADPAREEGLLERIRPEQGHRSSRAATRILSSRAS